MKITDVFDSKSVAAHYTEAASNSIAYLGLGFFPAVKRASLELKWITGYKGLPVSLMPSAFDAKSRIRDRVGATINKTDMPFFRESMVVTERDEQEIMRVQDSNDPYINDVLNNIYDDTDKLLKGADVVPERMRMQLLAPVGGNIGIEIAANDVTYAYNYDPDGSWKKDHFIQIVDEADKWTSSTTCKPLDDLKKAIKQQIAKGGNRPEILLLNQTTFDMIANSDQMENAILSTNIINVPLITDEMVMNYIQSNLKLQTVIYEKQYKNEAGESKTFYADNVCMLLPKGELGKTHYGTTPEERTGVQKKDADVSVVNTGVAVMVTISEDPVQTKTTVSEITLPSFEALNECFGLEVA